MLKQVRDHLFILIILFSGFNLYCQDAESIWMFPNKGQWDDKVSYKLDINQGDFFIDNKGFTFNFFESPLSHNHSKKRNKQKESINLRGQTIKNEFIDAEFSKVQIEDLKSEFHKNFYYGNKQIENIKGIKKLKYLSIYPGINLILETNNSFKYSFEISPHSNVNQIKQKISGSSKTYLDNEGNLHHVHILGEIIEKKPIAWYLKDNGDREFIKINFKLEKNLISYEFPNGYDKSKKIIIDPELIFSSFTGSTADNWGFTATNDNDGNLYSGGIAFGIGYPITIGTYDVNYHDGEIFQIINNGVVTNSIPGIDIVISKFSKDGTKLLFSTYLGGTGNETPHSLIVNKSNELLLFGATSSSNFPTTTNAYNSVYKKGNEFKTSDFYFSGSDIFVSKFSVNGDKLLSSTLIGGSGNDGLGFGDLIYNYGDNFRGEINLTDRDEVVITSTTTSSDFPLKSPFQNKLNGKSDAVVIKFSPNLDQLLLSSYFGGTGDETGNSVLFNGKNKKIYFTGGTTSNDLQTNFNVNKNNYHGGNSDGYIGIINLQNNSLESLRFIGTSSYDQSYFIQLDNDQNIYILGQTEGNIAISTGKYGNPNSGLFIQKFTPDLNTFLWSTTIGGQSGNIEISPTAFMVSNCNDIYLTGWGSSVNAIEGHVLNSTTNNFPVTNDAIQKETEGDNFYIAVLNNDGANLKYGSFFGGVGLFSSHVDGGTSRFDKKGGIYHAVCGACGGNPSGFTTTPGVWSENNKSNNCNLAAFKIELNKINAEAIASDSFICSGSNVQFTNRSKYADFYEWDFGDMSVSNEENPIHTFKTDGKYTIRLIATDSKKCVIPDTTFLNITINKSEEYKYLPTISLCSDSIIDLSMDFIENSKYSWVKNTNVIENENNQHIVLKISPPIKIIGIQKHNCTSTIYEYNFEKLNSNLSFNRENSLCLGEDIEISVTQVNEIEWINYPEWKNISKLNIKPSKSETYYFKTKSLEGCNIQDSLHIEVFTPNNKLLTFGDTTICSGDSIKLHTKYLKELKWDNTMFVNQTKEFTYIKPKILSDYTISYTDPCGMKIEKFRIDVHTPIMKTSNDTTICLGDSVIIEGFLMKYYDWQNYEYSKIQINSNQLKVSPPEKTSYFIIGTDSLNCKIKEQINVEVFTKPKINLIVTQKADWESPAIIKILNNDYVSYSWLPTKGLNCNDCSIVEAFITENSKYKVIVTDKNNCLDSQIVNLDFIDNLYVPNAFYPDSKNGNHIFKAVGTNIRDFEMTIYNRWGELIATISEIEDGWDGTYKGLKCPNDVYIWKIKYHSIREEFKESHGHVSLIR